MKRLFLFAVILLHINLVSQENWTHISPNPTSKNLFGVCFVSESEGWVVGIRGTVFHTEDGGQNWDKQFEDSDMSFKGIFFIDEEEGWVVGWDNVLHTINGGIDWEAKNLPTIFDVNSVYFVNHDIGWISGTYNLLYSTVDGGDNWIYEGMGGSSSPNLNEVKFFDTLNGIMVGGKYNNGSAYIKRTEDGGVTWSDKTLTEYGLLYDVQILSKDTILACGNGKQILRSTNGGVDWDVMGSDLPSYYNPSFHFFDSKNGVVLESNTIQYTNDGGNIWASVLSNQGSMNRLTFYKNTGYAVGFYGEIIKSTDAGLSWSSISSSGFPTPLDACFQDSVHGFARAQYYHTLLKTDDGGQDWGLVDIGSTSSIKLLAFGSSTTGYALSSEYLFKTMDGGENWESIEMSFSGVPNKMKFIDDNIGFIVGSNGGFYKTIDGGQNWEQINANTPHSIVDIEISLGATLWIISAGGDIVKSTDLGETWQTIQSDFGNLLSIYFYNDERGVVIRHDGDIYKTNDGGQTWDLVLTGSSNTYTAGGYFISENEAWMYANTRLYHTVDGGENWDLFYMGIPMYSMYFIDTENGWITGDHNFVMRYHKNSVGIISAATSSGSLLNPNPAVDFVTVKISENIQTYNILIINLLGQVYDCSTTRNGNQLRIDVASLPKGIYLVQLNAEKEQKVFKMLKQ